MFKPFIFTLLVLLLSVSVVAVTNCLPLFQQQPQKEIIIIDTDIGNDFDDSFSITAMLGNRDKYDIKLILTATLFTQGRAQIVADYLTRYNLKTQIPIGIGVETSSSYVGPLYGWSKNLNLTDYVKTGGIVHQDGVAAAAEIIKKYAADGKRKVTFLAIAPETNFLELKTRFPDLPYHNVGITAMAGSVYYCYGHQKNKNPGDCQEYNVHQNTSASQVFWNSIPWKPLGFRFTPLDSCGRPYSVISGNEWKQFLAKNNSEYPWVEAIIESYCYWAHHGGYVHDCARESSPLFDAVAAFLILTNSEAIEYDLLNITVNNNGETIIDNKRGRPSLAALTWKTGGTKTFFDVISKSIAFPKS